MMNDFVKYYLVPELIKELIFLANIINIDCSTAMKNIS